MLQPPFIHDSFGCSLLSGRSRLCCCCFTRVSLSNRLSTERDEIMCLYFDLIVSLGLARFRITLFVLTDRMGIRFRNPSMKLFCSACFLLLKTSDQNFTQLSRTEGVWMQLTDQLTTLLREFMFFAERLLSHDTKKIHLIEAY